MIAVYVPHRPISILRKAFQLTESSESTAEQQKVVRLAQQAATLAMEEYASEEQIIAAFLYGVDKLLSIDTLKNDSSVDSNREAILLTWLGSNFGEKVALPIILQSQAIRYLYTTMPSFGVSMERSRWDRMSSTELDKFKAHTYFRHAIQVCLWVDRAKTTQHETPTCAQFLDFVEDFHERYREGSKG